MLKWLHIAYTLTVPFVAGAALFEPAKAAPFGVA